MGEISYAYNGYGELVSQTDSHGTTTFEYDVLGRLTKETRPDFTYTYSYDNQLKGFIDTKSSSNNTSIAYKYDKYGRTISETHEMGNRSFTTRTSYNNINKPDTISYPSGFKIKLNYYDTGYQQSIHNAKSGLLIWEADDYDEFGNVAVAHIGNDRYTGRIYSPVGTIIEVGTDDILYCKYEYDGCNNLTSKIDNIRGNEEYYSYDALNRLTMATTEANGKSARIIDVEYDAGGNIISKSNVGNIEYKDGTNRLAMIEGYKIPEWESIKYTSFNKIKEVIATRNNGIRDIRFVYMMAYGPDKHAACRDFTLRADQALTTTASIMSATSMTRLTTMARYSNKTTYMPMAILWLFTKPTKEMRRCYMYISTTLAQYGLIPMRTEK